MIHNMHANVLAGFDLLIEQYYQPLFNFAVRLSGTPEAALDLTQQTFYLALRKCGQLREPGCIKSWLFTILRRQFLQQRRHESKFRHHSIEDCHAELPQVEAGDPTRLDLARMKDALADLHELYRVPLTLYYFEELSQRAIAAQLGVPVGTIMSRLSRGRHLMRRNMERKRKGGSLNIG